MQPQHPDRILRIKAVMALTGLTRSTLYRKMDAGTFPKNTRISARCVGWRESAVSEWLDSLKTQETSVSPRA
ncbi:transcriptional regulator, AlpA family [Sphingomonas sp. NFR04]|uniref:helix-turn-helix transcriptional regulator n=1 Tax=Sphingomonas sp. NFR04 TaxID=1566283 RepID=UPI0008E32AF6|nr:AlpA family transcriptional regulator [Sphingomonas sp. NFR04]SFJ91479.1 transcriptional regulator, AlpA family [Sphingomonas sp. NFR04]